MTPSGSAARFSGYCIAISAVPNMERLGEVCERFVKDDQLTSNQKDALEALAVAKERLLRWDGRGNA